MSKVFETLISFATYLNILCSIYFGHFCDVLVSFVSYTSRINCNIQDLCKNKLCNIVRNFIQGFFYQKKKFKIHNIYKEKTFPFLKCFIVFLFFDLVNRPIILPP